MPETALTEPSLDPQVSRERPASASEAAIAKVEQRPGEPLREAPALALALPSRQPPAPHLEPAIVNLTDEPRSAATSEGVVDRTILAVRRDVTEIERIEKVFERAPRIAAPIPQPGASSKQRPSPEPAQPEIQVTIGRVEIIAPPTAPAPVKRAPTNPGLSLAEYLEQRRGEI
jgi:hypothetical protein